MGWNYGRSLARVQRAYDETADLTVSDVVRETDLENTTLTNARRITAAHFYADVVNYRKLLAVDPITMPGDGEEAGGGEDLLHRSHLWAREVSRIVQADFEAAKVHFQGPKLHALAYRPIGDDQAMVTKAVLAAAAVRATAGVFADVLELDDDEAWQTAAGIDLGQALVTKDGVRGDRELLFLGNPANRAAKILNTGLRITADAADLLPDEFANLLATTSDPDVYALAIRDDRLEELAETHGYGWSRENSRDRLTTALEAYPPRSATVHTAQGKIDKDMLGMSNTKRVEAVSIFADVDGFTSYVEQAHLFGTLPEAVRAYHAIRSEMRSTAVADYEALRIQYQGDRMQALSYLPIGDPERAVLDAVKIAAALNSAVAEVLPVVIGSDAAKPLAIGLAHGTVLVSKLGEHGNRDIVTLGTSTADAARIQERLEGWQIGLDPAVYDQLPKWLAELFDWKPAAGAYVADKLKLDEVERAEDQADVPEASAQKLADVRDRASNGLVATATPLRPYYAAD